MIRNTSTAWGWPAKALHWLGALAILVLLAHGWWMTHITPRPERLASYAWHSALGYDLLALTLVRVLWRWLHPIPALPADTRAWERLAAQAGHVGLYLLMFIVALTGWLTATTFRAPMTQDLFGLRVPALVTSVERTTRNLFEEGHKVLAYVLAALVILHILGALRHHFGKKNDVLRRML